MSDGGVSIDPICGQPVIEDDGPSFRYKRRTYYFCSARCRSRFARRAERMRVLELARLGGLFDAKRPRWGLA